MEDVFSHYCCFQFFKWVNLYTIVIILMDNMYFFKTVLCVHVKEMFPLPFEIILPKTSIESILNLWQGLGLLSTHW